MNRKAVAFFISRILLLEALCMIPAAILCFTHDDRKGGMSFLAVIAVLLLAGVGLSFFKRFLANGIHAREGFATVAIGWIIMSFFGALPFYISGAIPRLIDAWFETVSGFTTTGSSILQNIEALSMGMLYWRAFIIWLGGMGILVFMLAIVPMVKGSGESLHILRAESPGPVISKLVPKMRSSARILYLIYFGLTVIMVALLLAGGMPFFDSLTTAFSTAGTGGFAIKNASIGFYQSYYLQTVISVFMLLFGVNFSLYYLLLLRDFKAVFKSEELRLYISIVAISTLAVTFNIRGTFETFYDALHHAFFQVSSIITTTGFSTIDFDLWPHFSTTILLFLMIIGACAGSTGGGLKISRLLILGKSIKHEARKMLHPRSVQVIKLDGKALDSSIISAVGGYFALYCLVCIISILFVAISSPSFTTSISSVLACVNNIGPGLHVVGPSGNYAGFSDLSKFVLSMDMLIGRLEIYPILLLFSPTTWLRGK